jgi:hypothetical protein
MRVESDWPITLAEERIARELGQPFESVFRTPKLLAVLRQELALIGVALTPRRLRAAPSVESAL